MAKRPLRPIREYLDLTPSEVEREIRYIERVLDGGIAMSQTDYELLELRHMNLQLVLMISSGVQPLDPADTTIGTEQVWLPRELPSKILREDLGVKPSEFTRVFYRRLPDAAKRENGYFRKLTYSDDYLLLNSLEALMEREDFQQSFLNIYKLRHGALRFVEEFVPRYRRWYLDQAPTKRPVPYRPG